MDFCARFFVTLEEFARFLYIKAIYFEYRAKKTDKTARRTVYNK